MKPKLVFPEGKLMPCKQCGEVKIHTYKDQDGWGKDFFFCKCSECGQTTTNRHENRSAVNSWNHWQEGK